MPVKSNLTNIKEPDDGQLICLIAGPMDPPSMDFRHIADALFVRTEVSAVWICPTLGSNHVKNMCSIFCAEYSSSAGRPLTFCSVALDRNLSGEDLAKWARSMYPHMKFKLVGTKFQDSEPFYYVKFAGQPDVQIGSIPLSLEKFHQTQHGFQDRVKSGKDESKHAFNGVWNYIQHNRLYR